MKKIWKIIFKWQNILGLQNWDIYVNIDKNVGKEACNKDWRVEAGNKIQLAYKLSTITFRNKKIDERTILHELVHLLTEEFAGYCRTNMKEKDQKWIEYYNERLISTLSIILWRNRK